MKRLSLRYVGLPLAAGALLAGCGGVQTPTGAPGTATVSAAAPVSMTMPHYVPRAVRADSGRSWMLPQKKGRKSVLIYFGSSGGDVYVYNYSNGKLVGTLTGVNGYGGCVDAKGDVFIAEFGNGTTVEYAHGGTKVLNTYSSGGEPIGCSLDAKGDLAVSSFSPGEATVFAGGNPNDGTTYASCADYQWAMGYDNKGNLIGVGYGSKICALMAGSTSMTTLSASGITIDFPGGTMWDGKYIALGDQEAGGKYETGVWPSMLSGSTLTSQGESVLTDTCYEAYDDIVNPFIVGKKNTPVNNRQGKVIVGSNVWCYDESSGSIGFWHYPQGGNPFRTIGSTGGGNVLAVTIGE